MLFPKNFKAQLFFAALFVQTECLSTTLDDALTHQLKFDGVPCFNLLGNDLPDVLTGELRNICTRPGPRDVVNSESQLASKHDPPITTPDRISKISRDGLIFFLENKSLDHLFEYQSDTMSVGGGFYRLVNARSAVGVLANYSTADGSYLDGGDFNYDGHSLLFFASYRLADNVTLLFSFEPSEKRYDSRQKAIFTAESGVTFGGETLSSYTIREKEALLSISMDKTKGLYTFTPSFDLIVLTESLGGYSEYGSSGLELNFHSEDRVSVKSSLGIKTSAVINGVKPYFSLQWRHEFNGDQQEAQVSFVGDTRSKRFTYHVDQPDSDFYYFGVGAQVTIQKRLNLFVDYEALLGHEQYHSNRFGVGLRAGF